MVRNLVVTRAVDHYEIAEQAGSNYKASRVLEQAESADAARQWLIGQGALQNEVDAAFQGFADASQVLIEISAASEQEDFPRQ